MLEVVNVSNFNYFLNMKPKYAYIEGPVFQLGLIHLYPPRCIYWFGTGFGDFQVEWLDDPTVIEGTQIILDLEYKMLEHQREGTKDLPYMYYEDL